MNHSRRSRLAVAAKSVLAWMVLMTLIFALAGRLEYRNGWIFGGLNLLILTSLVLFFPDMPEIMRERARPGRATKPWDRIFWAFFGPANLLVFVLAVLDGGRFHWTRSLPGALTAAAALVYVLGGALHFSAIKANEFYSSTVSIQSELGHEVVSKGPYRIVRHPGYSGILMMMASIPIVLGSLWALLPAAAVVLLIFARTILEDRSLKNELPGYREYAEDVKSRLLPGLW